MQGIKNKALEVHKKYKGKLEVKSKIPINNAAELSLVYSPGVAKPCMEIYKNKESVYDYTAKGNFVAVITDGTAVLGLGDIGPHAALPVMEGKAILFKTFAGVDAVPVCLNTTEVDKIVETIKLLEPGYGGINLEDISAPRCFEIEERLKKECNIPVFHDDQHGTAIVTAAGLINALKVVDKRIEKIRVVVNGAGAAGIAITKILVELGVNEIILCDTKGIIYEGRSVGMNSTKNKIAKITNKELKRGPLNEAIKGTDVFIGVSSAGLLTPEMIRSMNPNAIIFAMANPIPEIMPFKAKLAGAKVVATGRSDFPNQVNNVLAFPGIFRGALDASATEINNKMKLAAIHAIANIIPESELTPDYVIPDPFDQSVVPRVASAVAKAARESGVARIAVVDHV